MKKLSANTKFAHLGKPGTAFTPGFNRRLNKILEKVDLENKKIMDQGCGEGVWMYEFAKFTKPTNVYGCDIDKDSVSKFQEYSKNVNEVDQIPKENIKICAAENLTFNDDFFDIVFSNEVLEHVDDDQKAVNEVHRVLKKGGKFIIFTPNRGWPFETHGAFFGGKYYWGNIPLLPWMPRFVRKKYSPHVRNYSNDQLKSLFDSTKWKIEQHTHVFSGFDKLEKKFGTIGKIIKKSFHLIEKTPLHFFGISHFLIVKKI